MSVADVPTEYAIIPPEYPQRCAEVALTAVKASGLLRAPRRPEDRQNAFAGWIAQWRVKLEPVIHTALRREMPALFSSMPDTVLAQVAEQQVWPEVAGYLPAYGIMYQAGAWGRAHFGDGTMYGAPQQIGNLWRLPLGVRSCGENLGQITLDEDGNVIESLTSTRQDLLDKIRDNQLSSTPAAARQQ